MGDNTLIKKININLNKSYHNISEINEQDLIQLVNKNGYYLKYIDKNNQTERICLAAVKQYSFSLKFVKNQTEKICLEAVKNNGYSLKYVLNKTEKIILEAYKQNKNMFENNMINNKYIVDYLSILNGNNRKRKIK